MELILPVRGNEQEEWAGITFVGKNRLKDCEQLR